MSDIKFSLPGADTVTLTGGQVDKLVRRGDGDAALLYLYILRRRGVRDNSEMAADLGKTEADIEASMRVLCSVGLLEGRGEEPAVTEPSDEPCEHTAEEVRQEAQDNPEFRSLVDEASKMLGRVLSAEDMKKLYGIYGDLGLPCEVILQLITFCIDESRRGTDPLHMPRMRYIEKTAYEWERNRLFTLEDAERYIKDLTERRSDMSKVRRMMGINDRRLTKSEENYIHSWLSRGFTPEAISVAFERTADRTGKLSWKYMNSILASWHEKGIHTEAEIEAKDSRSSKPSGARNAGSAPGTADDRAVPETADVQRLRDFLDKMKEEN